MGNNEFFNENTEVIETETEIVEDGTEIVEAGEESGAGSDNSNSISSDDIEIIMNDVLTEYFETTPVQVVVVDSESGGINKPIEEFTLVEVCLVLIVLILLGRAILDIIGGRAWNK